jgi:ribosomal protein S18 acetylase RimI-like enzyme
MQTPRYTIRDATEADVPAILAMHAQSWLDTYPNEAAGITREWVKEKLGHWSSEENIEKRRDVIRKCKDNPDALYRVAVSDRDEIIGMIAPFRNETVQRVGAIYVAKEYHGSGLAQALMDEIIAWKDPRRPLELTVATYNERAKAFYRKYGFKEINDSEHIVHERIPVITMIRKGDKQ